MTAHLEWAVPRAEDVRVTSARIGSLEFELLVERHHLDLVRFAYGLCGDREIAEDAVQSCWHAAWRSRSEIRDPDRVRGWLFTVTANDVRRQLRRRRLASLLHGRLEPPAPSQAIDPEFADLAHALAQLPDRDRQIVIMRYALGLTSEEIGNRFGLSGPGIRRRLQSSLARLRARLGEDFR
jgi:RNA polymerase sigma factor (sigma-70 family)